MCSSTCASTTAQSSSPTRSEYLNGQLFDTLLEARVLLERWRIDFNERCPHSSLRWQTPSGYRRHWINQHQLQLA
jgi:putative transposase